jgi:toxin ParE1/3/4
MQQKTYKLSVLPLFEEDLNEIVDYITNKLQNSDAARRLVEGIEIAINTRLKTPFAFAPFSSAKERTHPYYRINVRNICWNDPRI